MDKLNRVLATHWPVAPFEADKTITPTQCFASLLKVPKDEIPTGAFSNTDYPSYAYGGVLGINEDGSATVLSGGGARWLNTEPVVSKSPMLAGQSYKAFPNATILSEWSHPLAIP